MSSSEVSSRAAPMIDLKLRPGGYQLVDWAQSDGTESECVLMFTAGCGLILASPQGDVKKVTSVEDLIGAVIITKTEPPTVVLQFMGYNLNLFMKNDRRNKNNDASKFIVHINATRERAGKHLLVPEVCNLKGITHNDIVQFKHPVKSEQRIIEEYVLSIAGKDEIGMASRDIDGTLQIYNTIPGSPAAEAKVKQGSTLISIGGLVLDPNNGPLKDQVTGVVQAARRDNEKFLQITTRVPPSTVIGAEPVSYSDPRVPILSPLTAGTKALVVFVYEENQLTHSAAITRVYEGLQSLYRSDKVKFLTNTTPLSSSRTAKVLRHEISTEKEILQGMEWLVQDSHEESLVLMLITPSRNGDSIVTADNKLIHANTIINTFSKMSSRTTVSIFVDTRPSCCFGFRFQDNNSKPPPASKSLISVMGVDCESGLSDPGIMSQCFVTAHLRNLRGETVNFIRACLPPDSRLVWVCNQKFNSTFPEGMPVKSVSGWWKSQIPAIIWQEDDFMIWIARFYRRYNLPSVQKASSIAHENKGREYICVQALMEKYLTSGVGLAISEAVTQLGEALKYSPVDTEKVFQILKKINRQEIWKEASKVYREAYNEHLKKSLKHNLGKSDYDKAKSILRDNNVIMTGGSSSSSSSSSSSRDTVSKSETINSEVRKKVRSSFASSNQPLVVIKDHVDAPSTRFSSSRSSSKSSSASSSSSSIKVSKKSSKISKISKISRGSTSKVSKHSKASKSTKKSVKTNKSEDAASRMSKKSKTTTIVSTRRSNSSDSSISSSSSSSSSSEVRRAPTKSSKSYRSRTTTTSSSPSSSEEVKKPTKSSLKSGRSRTPESSSVGPPHYGESHPVPPPTFSSARSPYHSKQYSNYNNSPSPRNDASPTNISHWRQQHHRQQQGPPQQHWSPPPQPSLRDIIAQDLAQAESLLGGPVSLTGSAVPPYKGSFVDMNKVQTSPPPSGRFMLSAPALVNNQVAIPLHDTVSFGNNVAARSSGIEGVSLETWEPLPIPSHREAPTVPPVFFRQGPPIQAVNNSGRLGDSPSSELSMPDVLL